MASETLKKCCKQHAKKTEIDFIVTLPAGGEFSLRIYKTDEYGDEMNVCNYLFMEADDSSVREVCG